MKNSIAERIAEYVRDAGGRTFYVGGFVRDRLLGIENKDVDIEVHGIQPAALYSILEKTGEPLSYGRSFGVFALKGEDIDIAMPRREHATGSGHRDFEIDVDPFIGTLEAARRRDFTINSMMEDVLTGEIVDHFGGRRDIDEGVIRHIDPDTFIEDPLRVLRGAQFAARFNFAIAPDTIELCRGIDLSTLSRERVEEELKKALLKADKPSIFFESLRAMDQLDIWFPELKQTIDLEQDPVFHPEGDVWTHTMEVIDRAAAFRDRVSDPYSFMLLALTHDLGKIVTTEEKKGRIHAYEHEVKGMPLVEAFVGRLTSEKSVKDYVFNMVPLHMRPNVAAYSKPVLKSTNRMFDAAVAPGDLIWFAEADKPVVSGSDAFSGDREFLLERLRTYEETMAKPYVMGRDLIEAGLEPGEDFGEILAYAHKLRLAGIEKDSAMKQVLTYARKSRKGKR
ncbi:MAG: CCA tRNA nucleotidyltransferase [Mogibacterium sp.]|nr:CCA tRNA nucleotidyltransferase [Mogibacterium sp.]